jgi:hypothetical protein
MKSTNTFQLALAVLAAALAIVLATASTASADYGRGAVYQVEISANPPGSGFWIWAELDPGMTSGDYQETDCIHSGAGGPNGALHDAGSVTGWSIDTNARTLTMYGVKIIGNAETVNITVPLPANGSQYGHSNSMTISYVSGIPIIPFAILPAQVQLAP